MASRVFRKVALDRLSSPEQLDQPVRINAPQEGAALAILAACVVIALLWAWFGSIPIELTARGTLQQRSCASMSGGNELLAVLYLPASAQTQLHAGLETHIFPAQAGEDQYRSLKGRVSAFHVVVENGTIRTKVEVEFEESRPAADAPPVCTSDASQAPIRAKIVVRRNRPLTLLFGGLQSPGGA